MIYVVTADIHANLEALTAALDLAGARGGQQILCLGDVVGYRASPNECVRLLHEKKAIAVVGNHDLAAIGQSDLEGFCESARRALRWTRPVLSDDSLAYLRALPLVRWIDEPQIVLVHASLDPQPNAEERLDDEERIRRTFQAMIGQYPQAKVCFFGHTHRRAAYVYRDGKVDAIEQEAFRLEPNARYLINPGSVGMSRDAGALHSLLPLIPLSRPCGSAALPILCPNRGVKPLRRGW